MRAAWRAERVRMENGMCMVDVDCNFIRQDRGLGSDRLVVCTMLC